MPARSFGQIGWPLCLLCWAAARPFASGESGRAEADFSIDADFPGGNIRVLSVEGDRAVVAPDLRDIQPGKWWFYWSLRFTAPAGTRAEIVFRERNPIGVRGPACSADGGATWSWMGADSVASFSLNGKPAWSFEARVPEGAAEIRYSGAIQYLETHLQAWLARHRGNPALRVEELCRSREGRCVELLRAGCLDADKARGTVLLTSRHHCCETMGTYVMEGLLDSVLADDDLGRRWRERWLVLDVPFMDKDGVEKGDQGKNRDPHDHNRDYIAQPLYPEVAALMRLGDGLRGRGAGAGPEVAAMLDLHCPTLRGEWNDRAYLVGSSDPFVWENQQAFMATLERLRRGPVPFDPQRCLLPYGVAWNKAESPAEQADGARKAQLRSSAGWARDTFPEALLTATLETAYADALGVEVNAESARAIGRDLARALDAHLDGFGVKP